MFKVLTKKRVTAVLLVLCTVLSLAPFAAFAATSATETADFTTGGGTAAIRLLNEFKTDGAADSTWDNGSKILTLKGVDFTTSASTGVRLPHGSTVVLADGTANSFMSGDATANINGEHKNAISVTAVDAVGDLTVKGGTAGSGTLTVTSGSHKNVGDGWTYSSGITVGGNLTVKGGNVTARGGLSECRGLCLSIGVNMDNNTKNKALLVTGGSLTAIGGEAYSIDEDGARSNEEFSRGVYLYRGNISVSGDGRLSAQSIPSMADAGILSNGLYISVGDLSVAGAGEVYAVGAYGA